MAGPGETPTPEAGRPPTRVASEDDLPAIGETLARAFEHDPIWGWAFEDAERERKLAALGTVFGFCAAAALDLGWVRLTSGAEAVALWIPPGAPEMSPADAERFPAVVAGACSEASAARVLDLMAAFERNHPHEPMHFYLSLLGTHPDHAGKGLGMALLAATLAEIDAEDAPAYLESSNPGNVPRYERLGFASWREAELLPGIPATQMWRGLAEPQIPS
jgi:GNAT superfamily N-acetyltransferase